MEPWAISAAVARFLHTEEVTGSIPVWPTQFSFDSSKFQIKWSHHDQHGR